MDGEDTEFQALNRVLVYPGKQNVWLVAKTSEGSGDIQDFCKEFILGPLDTSWVSNNVAYVVRKVNPGEEPRLHMQAFGLRMQETGGNPKTQTTLTPPVQTPSGTLEWYVIMFTPPLDAPSSLPWPVKGCVEEAGWYLSAATSDVLVSTGKPIGFQVKVDPDAVDPVKTAIRYAVAGGVIVGLVYLTPALARAYYSFQKAKRSV